MDTNATVTLVNRDEIMHNLEQDVISAWKTCDDTARRTNDIDEGHNAFLAAEQHFVRALSLGLLNDDLDYTEDELDQVLNSLVLIWSAAIGEDISDPESGTEVLFAALLDSTYQRAAREKLVEIFATVFGDNRTLVILAGFLNDYYDDTPITLARLQSAFRAN